LDYRILAVKKLGCRVWWSRERSGLRASFPESEGAAMSSLVRDSDEFWLSYDRS
jgi:hypothetical protein